MGRSRRWWLIGVVLSLVAAPAADAARLRLDGRFGEGGVARVPFRLAYKSADLRPLRPVRQPDGKVVVAASAYFDHGNSQILLARFTRRGRPDPTFGHGGWEHLGLRWNFDPRSVRVQPDGRILVLGAAGYGPGLYPPPGQFGLVRLLPDGSRDRTFGTNGFVTWNPPWRAGTLYMTALPGLFVQQRDGRLLAAGQVEELRGDHVPVRRVAFVRFEENGSVDESFGRAGLIEQLEGPDFFSYAWAALPDGDLVTLASRAGRTWWLHRFNPDGTLDREFGQDGSARLELNDLYDVGELVPMRDGGLVIVRATALRRIDPTGQLDRRFGTSCGRQPPVPAAEPPPLLPVRPARNVGAVATSDGGGLATVHAFPPRRDSFVIRYGSDGCATAGPLRLRALSASPPVLQGRHTAMVGASYDDRLALIRIRR